MSDAREGSPLLSVVVPVYGVEAWLPEFLDSLVAQSFTRWKAILVIDGSPDNSEAIAREYAARDPRISVHSFENGGVGRARNRGFALVDTEFVAFPDPDDILAPDAYALLVGSLQGSGSDIASAIGEDIFEDGHRETYWAQTSRLFRTPAVGITLHSHPQLVLDHVTWNKVYRTSLLRENSIEYPVDTRLAEDVVHALTTLRSARAVDVIPEVIYYHRRRDGALTSDVRSATMLRDWEEQTTIVAEIVAGIGDAAVSHEYFTRLLDSEVWWRISLFDEITDSEALASLERFVATLVTLVPTSALAHIPFRKRVLVHFMAEGILSRLWRQDGVTLNPMRYRKGVPALSIEIAARSMAGLQPAILTERLMLRFLLDSIASELLQSGSLLDDRQWDEVFAEVAAVWPAGSESAELSSSPSVPVIDAVRSSNRDILRAMSEAYNHNDALMHGIAAADDSPLLSVVVPIYGVEEWLPEFLDSLIAQSLTNWQAILVIDGSPDNSEAIARDYASRDPRFTVHVFENGGLGRARNRGFELATGTYVTFPDPDDVLSSRAYELLVGSLLLSGSDIATGKAEDFFEDGRTELYWAQRARMFAVPAVGVTLDTEPELILDHVAWNKVFRTSLLRENDIEYPVDTLCEDVVHSLRSHRAATGVDVISEIIYFHRRRDNAITANLYSARIVNDWIEQTSQAVDLVLDIGNADVSETYFKRLLGSEVWTRVRAFNRIAEDDSFARLERFAAKLLAVGSPAAIDFIPPRTRTMIQLVANGSVGRYWRTPGFSLNPLYIRVDSPVLAIQVRARSAARLPLATPVEEAALGILLDEIARTLLARSNSLTDRQFDAIFSELRSVWPGGIPAEAFASPQSVSLLAAAHNNDRRELRALSAVNIGSFHPVVTAIKRHGSAVLLTGEVLMDVVVDEQTRMEIVLRSRTSTKVRAMGAVHWNVTGESDEPTQWRATVATTPDMFDEEWVVWLRASRNSLPPIQALVARGEQLLDASLDPMPMKTSVVSVHEDDTFVFSLAAEASASDDSTVAAAYDALRQQENTLPDRIWVFPYWHSNPYLEMLYLASQSRGVSLSGTAHFDVLLDQLGRATDRDVFHLHWTAPIAQRAETEEQASAQVAAFTAALLSAKDRGVQVYWTVHNKLPHHLQYRELELELCRFLAANADVVHVMSHHTVEAVADTYDVNQSEVLVVEHSSYLGVYGSGPGRAAARAQLGVADDETAVLFLGRLLPYKGILTLLKSMQLAGERREKLVLLLAGEPDPEYLDLILENLPTSVRVVSTFESVPDDEIGLWFSAADVEALPYEEILNSGSLYLAATFSVPVLMPDAAHLTSQFADEPWVVFFDRGNAVDSLADAIVGWNDSDGELAKHASAAAHANTPFDMSTKFADGLSRLRKVRKLRLAAATPDSSPVI